MAAPVENAKKPITPENMQNLALKMIDYFNQKSIGLWYNIHILVNNEMWSSEPRTNSIPKTSPGNTTYYVTENVDAVKQNEYANPDTITILFDGSPLYQIINYHDFDYILKLDNMFLKEYGMYFELGYAWSMSAYS
jgi:hypothetical protein